MKLYQYPNCSTCRKAIKFLKAHNIEFESIDVTLNPPSVAELQAMLQHQNSELKKLFNTSGVQYRELDMKNKLPEMTEAQAIELLSSNGKLIKRPFLLSDAVGFVGFKEDVWEQLV